jgi:hypothetical protein
MLNLWVVQTIMAGTVHFFFLKNLFHFFFLSVFPESMDTLNFALQCRIQVEEPNAIHK